MATNKIFNWIMGIRSETEPFDPEVLNDDLALYTPWEPLVGGGSRRTTHRLKQAVGNRLVFRAEKQALFFGWLLWTGVPLLILACVYTYQNDVTIRDLFGPIVVIAGIAMCYGIYHMRNLGKPRQFDLGYGFYWKGHKDPQKVLKKNTLEDYTLLKDIHALQIIKERCSNSDDDIPYLSYELNLVCEDASRINITDHSDIAGLRDDADVLAEFLGGIPIWDASLGFY